jgi:hypothetical protein
MRAGESLSLRQPGGCCALLASDAEVRLRLRTIVESQHCDYVSDQFLRQMDASSANPAQALPDSLVHQRDSKGTL